MKYLFFLILLSGCASAQMVKETKNGGRVIVVGTKSVAAESGKQKARDMMKLKCGGSYQVVETGLQASGTKYGESEHQYYEFICGGAE